LSHKKKFAGVVPVNGRQLICESLAINPQVAVSPLKSNGALTEKLVLTCLKSDMLDF